VWFLKNSLLPPPLQPAAPGAGDGMQLAMSKGCMGKSSIEID
jgi:hypothetical protein